MIAAAPAITPPLTTVRLSTFRHCASPSSRGFVAARRLLRTLSLDMRSILPFEPTVRGDVAPIHSSRTPPPPEKLYSLRNVAARMLATRGDHRNAVRGKSEIPGLRRHACGDTQKSRQLLQFS